MPLNANELKGIWAAMPVSWSPSGELDEATLRENVRRMCRAGVHGVYTHGTTGEFYAQSEEEWGRVTRATLEESKALNVHCQIGCTALWTGEVIRRAVFAQALGAAAVQIAFPFWMELTDLQAVRFLEDVTRAVPEMPMVLYNTGRSKKPLTRELLRRILDGGVHLIGCKGVENVDQLRVFSSEAPHVKFFVGEALLNSHWDAGARGSYSAFVLACPAFMLRYFHLCEQRHPEAERIGQGLQRFLEEFIKPLIARGLFDTALDRCIASTTGFLQGPLLVSRPPYDATTESDATACRAWFSQNLPEFLQEV